MQLINLTIIEKIEAYQPPSPHILQKNSDYKFKNK
jgi:hypothetical protein